MTTTQTQLINLLAGAVNGTPAHVSGVDFKQLENISVSHYCNSLLCQGLINSGIEPPKAWKDAAVIVAINNYKNLTVQNEVVNIINENDITCAVIKGITAAVNYVQPMSRALGDVDILVKETDYEKAVALFGFETEKRENKFHTAFNYKGVSIEIHKGIDDYKTGIFGDKLSLVMKNSLNDIKIIEFDGYKIPCLKNEYQALMYLNHMYRHFIDNELSMRMFCDWVAFVSKISDDEWNNNIYKLLKDVGFNLFADALNIAANKYMNIDTIIKVNSKTDEKLVDYLMEEFVFDGTKTGDEFLDGNIATAYSKNNNRGLVMGTIVLLNTIAKREFNIAKYNVFLPLCWIYIIFRYLLNAATGKRKVVSYKKIDETVSRRNRLKKELKLI